MRSNLKKLNPVPMHERFEDLMAMPMKIAVFYDVLCCLLACNTPEDNLQELI